MFLRKTNINYNNQQLEITGIYCRYIIYINNISSIPGDNLRCFILDTPDEKFELKAFCAVTTNSHTTQIQESESSEELPHISLLMLLKLSTGTSCNQFLKCVYAILLFCQFIFPGSLL